MFRFFFFCCLASGAAFAVDDPAPSGPGPISSRWLQLDTASLALRFVTEQASNSGYAANQWQQQQVFSGSLKFDAAGDYSVHALVATGNLFNAGWNNTSAGSGPALSRSFWKQLYFSAKPVHGVEFQFGGIGIDSPISDIIGYSGEGYLTGSRLIVRKPRQFFFDVVSAAYAYLGDLNSPDMNGRFHRLGEANFQQ